MDQLPTPMDVVAQRTALSSLIILWKEFDLDGKRASFDAQATEIGNNKEASVKARKNLAKQTQDFKKTTDEEKLSNLGGLLKHYQEEVDRLTRRSKTAEASFLNLYKSISEMQDPVPIMEISFGQASQLIKFAEADQENKKLMAQQAEFAREFQGIKNQEVTVRKLEEALKEQTEKLDTLVEDRVAGIAKQLREDHSLETEMLKERVNELQSQLSSSHSEQSRYDKSLASRQAEVDLITADLDRAQSHIATLEREYESLKNRFKGNSQESSHKDIDLELSVAHKEIELARLDDQVSSLEHILEQERENNYVTVERLNNELQIQRARYDQLAAEAAALPDVKSYDVIQHELEEKQNPSLPSSATSVNNSSNALAQAQSTAHPHSNKAVAMSVEQALRDKNRQLESESMKLKMYLGERESEVSTLRERVGQLESQVTEYQSLVETLENDLAKKHPPSSPKLAHGTTQPANTTSEANAGFPPASSSDMLEIVCGQRDRFKIRLTEMEQENDRVAKQLEIARAELASYRQDNVKLYEKIRYLQSYNESRAGRGSNDVERGENKGSRMSDDLENKYGKLYEDTVVNPFAIFNRKERYRRYRELNHAERVLLNTSQFFLSSKGPRLFLFCYSVLLHLLVFGTLYKLAYDSTASLYPPPPPSD